ncbi:MAG: TonB-dependent receptor [Gammaproteobacteria bacterium]
MVSKRRTPKRQSAAAKPTQRIARNALSVAIAAALAGAPTGAFAQDSDQQPIEEVVIYGQYRQSLVTAIGTKRDATTIVEALSAEDIGKLPDSSIAESIARIPGLAGARVNGRTSGVSVRGFKEDFVGSTLNGRELVGIGDNRGVEYDLYPSEIVSGVIVHKTADATLPFQGIGGGVDLRTTRPLEADPTLAVNGVLEQNDLSTGNPDFDDNGHRLSLNFSDKFANDTIGLALAIATTESPSQEEQFRGWGYATVNPGGATAGPGITLDGSEAVLGGHDSFVRSAVLERDTVAGVLQFEPNDSLSVTLDALYIDFQEDKVFRGVEEGGAEWGTGSYTVTELENGLVTAGNIDGGFNSVIRNDAEREKGELTTGGLNVAYALNDAWTLKFDGAYSDVSKEITNVESYAGVGRAGSATQGGPTIRSFRMTGNGAMYLDHPTATPTDLTDFNQVRLAGPQSWGGALSPVQRWQETAAAPGIGPSQAQDGFVNNPTFDEQLTTLRLDADWAINAGIVSGAQFGINFSQREKTKVNRGAFLTAPSWPSDGAVPEAFRVGTADLGFVGIPGVVAYDSLGLFNSGFYTQTDAGQLETGRAGDTYVVEEDVTTLFGKVEFATEVGGRALFGNLGLQLIDSDQKASGFSSLTGPDGFVDATPVSGGDSYTDVLPSLNLNYQLADDHLLRFAYSTTISRARIDDLRPNNQVTFLFNANNVAETTDVGNSPWQGSAGNPLLKPLESDNLDLSYEWYFANDGFLSVAYFYKDLVNWHREGLAVADFTPFYIPGYHQVDDGGTIITPQLFEGIVTFREDGLTGSVNGFELQATVPFGLFFDALDGLGFSGSVAFNDGDLDDGSPVPGLSDEIYQATLFYERGGFAARLSGTKRSKFQTEDRGLSLALVPVEDQGAELLDAQISYDFGLGGVERLDGLFIALQAQNLTDEDTTLTNPGDSRQVTRFQTFGSNFLLNAIYRFK